MSFVICYALSLIGKSSPICYLGAKCPFRYKKRSVCQEDAELKSFDSKLHHRTSEFFSSLGKNETQSQDALKQICGFLLELSQEVVTFIIDNKEEFSKKEELKSLLDLYCESTNMTLNFFKTVEKYVKEADLILLNIRLAIQKYETLEKLNNNVTHMGDSFVKQYMSLHEEHDMILKKIGELQAKLDDKLENVNKGREVAKVFFKTVSTSLFVLSVGVCIVPPHPVPVRDLALVFVGPATERARSLVDGMLKKREEVLERRIQSALPTYKGTKVNMELMKTINGVVVTLQSQIKSIFETVSAQYREEEAMKLAMEKLITEVNEFSTQIKFVGLNVATCSKSVTEGKARVLKHITS